MCATFKEDLERMRRNPFAYVKIGIFFVIFIISLYLGVSLIQVNTSVNGLIITGNLSTTDKSVGEGLLGLFTPLIGVAFGIAFIMATLIFETFSEVNFSERMSGIEAICKKILETVDPPAIPTTEIAPTAEIEESEKERKRLDETLRQNLIQREKLKIEIVGIFLTVSGSAIVVELFIIGNLTFSEPLKMWGVYAVIVLVIIAALVTFAEWGKVEKIFKK
jgi:hypothetical protein